MVEMLNRFWKEEEGQDLVEYALIVGLVAVVIIAMFGDLRSALNTAFRKIISALSTI